MKVFYLAVILLASGHLAYVLPTQSKDFLSSKTHLIIYTDGIPKDILDNKQPMLVSWRPNILEIRNLCKVAQCNYQFLKVNSMANRFVSTKCMLVNASNACESTVEKTTIYTLEEVFHQSDFTTSLTLGKQKFSLIGSCKTENAIVVMEVDPSNLVQRTDDDDLGKKLKVK